MSRGTKSSSGAKGDVGGLMEEWSAVSVEMSMVLLAEETDEGGLV